MFLPSNITLSPGDSGDFVRELQKRLSNAGVFPEENINGFYDGMTSSAVSRFQAQTGLRPDGIAGPQTIRRLNSVLSGNFGGGTTSNSENHAEEEHQKAEDIQKNIYHAEQQPLELAQDPLLSNPPATPPDPTSPPAPPAQDTGHIPPPAPSTTHQDIATAHAYLAAQEASQTTAHPLTATPTTPPPLTEAAQAAAPATPLSAGHALSALFSDKPAPSPIPPTAQDAALHDPTQKPIAPTQPEQPAFDPYAMLKQSMQQRPTTSPAAPTHPEAATPPPPPATAHAVATSTVAPAPEAAYIPATPLSQPTPAPEQQQPAPQAMAQTPPAVQTPASAPEEEKPSLRQRLSGMVQKLATYFESKLPPSVLNEVKNIGLTLSHSGVKENPIPAEPSLPSPSQTPGLGAPGKQAQPEQARP